MSQLALDGLKADVKASGGELPAENIALSASVDAVNYDLNAGLAKLDQVQANVDLSGGELPADSAAISMSATAVDYDLNAASADARTIEVECRSDRWRDACRRCNRIR